MCVVKRPNLWLWLGDSVYAKQSVRSLNKSYAHLKQSQPYKDFSSKLDVDGIWDDHDLGVNDGGKYVKDKDVRAKLFLDFLNSGDGNSEQGLQQKSTLAAKYVENQGLYHSRIVEHMSTVLKIIFLDTRYQRDTHFIRSVGEIHAPLTAHVSAAFRTVYSSLGFGRDFGGDVLGEKQWKWLEDELETSTANYHIIVSSIQIMTTNPAVESWNHFPTARKRLFGLLQRADPRGLLLLSGDVHHGEAASTAIDREGGTDETLTPTPTKRRDDERWVEVTSSGLTHSCAEGLLNGLLCPWMVDTFHAHRDEEDSRAYYLGRNYGSVAFDAESLEVFLHSLTPPPVSIYSYFSSSAPKTFLPGDVVFSRKIYSGPARSERRAITAVHLRDFSVLSTNNVIMIASALFVFTSIALYLAMRVIMHYSLKKKQKII